MRIAALILLAAVTAQAQEPVVTLHSTVSGSREQPKVMYIVPWQQPDAAQLDYELHNGIAPDLFTPLDRDEYRRSLTFRAAIRGSQAANNDAGAGAGTATDNH